MNALVPRTAFDVVGFSYAEAGLSVEAEATARGAADAIRRITARTIPEIGRHLITAKGVLPHGSFTPWAEAELGIGARSAQSYMAAAGWLEGKSATLAGLPPTILYALSAKNAPAEVVQHVVEQAEASGTLSVSDIRSKLANARMEQLELRVAQRRKPDLTAAELRKRKQKEREKQAKADAEIAVVRQQEEASRAERLTILVNGLVETIGHRGCEALFLAISSNDAWSFRTLLGEAVRATAMQGLAKETGA